MRAMLLALVLGGCERVEDEATTPPPATPFPEETPAREDRDDEPRPGELRDAAPGHPVADPKVPSAAPGLRGDENTAPYVEPVPGDERAPEPER